MRPRACEASLGRFDRRSHSTSIGADDHIVFDQETNDLRLHFEMEAGIALGLLGEKIEKVPLRHEGDEFAAGRKVRKIRERHIVIADLALEHAQLLMRPLEEVVEHTELMHDLERGGMDGVAAKVAEEIGVFLQHNDVDVGAGKEEAEHHAGRSAAGDATARG